MIDLSHPKPMRKTIRTTPYVRLSIGRSKRDVVSIETKKQGPSDLVESPLANDGQSVKDLG